MKLSEQLLKKAEYFKSRSPQLIALELLKQAGLDEDTAKRELAIEEMEKSAASSLVDAGIDYDEAVRMVKVAGEDTKITSGNFSLDSFGEAFDALMKVAGQVAELEAQLEQSATENSTLIEKVAAYEEALNEQVPQVETDPVLEKVAAAHNLDVEEVSTLKTLPSHLLEKLASGQHSVPSMGRPGGRTVFRDAMDEFLFGEG